MARYLEVAAKGKRGLNWDGVRDEPYPGCMVYDMTKLPMRGVSDNTYDGVYSEHFIEHLTKKEGEDYLLEMFRIMKPGGIIRTVWPPHEFIDKLLSDQKLTNEEEYFCANYHNFYVVKHGFCPKEHRNKSIREQCAHGFQTLDNNCELIYIHSENWVKDAELGLRWNDPNLNINWPLEIKNISDRDKNLPFLK